MLGAIIGDIVGSRFEFDNHKSKDFELFTEDSQPTDDSILTLATARTIIDHDVKYKNFALDTAQEINSLADTAQYNYWLYGRDYPDAGYGGTFIRWMMQDRVNCQPYNSYGNGAGMRISPCAWLTDWSLEKVLEISDIITSVTHNHPEGIRGARAITEATYLAARGKSKNYIENSMKRYYNIDFTLDDIRDNYEFDVTCQGSVPVALEAFFESTYFEDAIRNAISMGGDSDTIAAMTGAIAGAYYGIPKSIYDEALDILENYAGSSKVTLIVEFENRYGKEKLL